MPKKLKGLLIFLVLIIIGFTSVKLISKKEELRDSWQDGSWAHKDSNLKPDSKVVFGKLKNGFRYAIIPNSNDKGRASLFLNVQAGSLMEDENEQGYAHFVEHMAFNGTSNFPPNTLIPFFQENGMNFGGDTNAQTSLTDTVYMLNLAKFDLETIGTGLDLLRDFSDGQLFLAAEVESEKKVILAEITARNSEAYQAANKKIKTIYAGTKFANEIIGSEESIKNVNPESLLNFYQKWYQAHRLTLVVVGDVKASELSVLIEEKFKSLKKEKRKSKVKDWGHLTNKTVKAFYNHRPISSTTVFLQIDYPVQVYRDSEDLQKKNIIDGLIKLIMQRRLELRGEKNPDIWNSVLFTLNRYNALIPTLILESVGKAEDWSNILTIFSEEINTVLATGILEEEVSFGKDFFKSFLEQRQQNQSVLSNYFLASEFIWCLNNNRVYTSFDDDLVLYNKVVSQIGREDINKEIREIFKPQNRTIYISGDAKINNEEEIFQAWEKALKTPPKPYQENKNNSFPYLETPANPQELPILIEQSLGQNAPTLYSAVLKNGVEFYLLPLSYEKDRVLVSLSFNGGLQNLKDEDWPKAQLAQWVLQEGGVGALNKVESDLLFISKGISLGESYSFLSAFISGAANISELETLLEAIWTQYKDPVPLEGSLKKVLNNLESNSSIWEKTVKGVASSESEKFFYGNKKRFSILKAKEAQKIDFLTLKNYILSTRNNAPLRLFMSGDFNAEEVLPLLSRFFTAEEIKEGSNSFKAAKPVFPQKQNKTITVEDEVDQAIMYWGYKKDLSDIEKRNLLTTRQIMASALENRLLTIIREQLGASYGISVNYQTFENDDGFAILLIQTSTSTKNIAEVEKTVALTIAEFVESGVDAKELERVVAPLTTAWLTNNQALSFWHFLIQEDVLRNRPYVKWNNEVIQYLRDITPEIVSGEIKDFFENNQPSTLLIRSENNT